MIDKLGRSEGNQKKKSKQTLIWEANSCREINQMILADYMLEACLIHARNPPP